MPKKRNNRKKRAHTKKNQTPLMLPEYYQFVWPYIYDEFHQELNDGAVTRPTDFRKKILSKVTKEFNSSAIDRKYKILSELLSIIEDEFNRILSKHSVFYWIHIYRRIAPHLADALGNNTDEETVIAVRNHLEQAIYKYGDLSKNDDYALSSDVEFEDILGGLLFEYIQKALPNDKIKFYADGLKKNKQWVLTTFSKDSLVDMYYLEGIAYQYWYVLAKMRAIGKNIDATIDPHGFINENRSNEQDLLIKSFDKRNSENSPLFGMSSNVGTFVKSEVGTMSNTIFCAFINSIRYKLSDFGVHGDLSELSPNFLPFFVNADSFYNAHKYLEKKFFKRLGFGLLEICQMIQLLSQVALSSMPNKVQKAIKGKKDYWLYNHFQRGYKVYALNDQDLKDDLLDCLKQLRHRKALISSSLEEQFDKILEFITLKDSKQESVGIWSNGPKPVLIKSSDGYILEYTSIYYLLENLFFGLRYYDPKNKKGFEFEDAFCELARSKGFDVILDSTEIKLENKKREVDAGVRIGNRLYLFECKCFERPLNFNIGDPKTISHRILELDKKLEQADTLKEFVVENMKGTNYDFSWATEIYSFVVSSYTEWIWSKEERLWTKNSEVPRILSAYEAIELLKSEEDIV